MPRFVAQNKALVCYLWVSGERWQKALIVTKCHKKSVDEQPSKFAIMHWYMSI